MSTSKNHHFNPQSILRNFINEESKIQVFDKQTGKSHSSSVKNAGSENFFNTVDVDGQKINLEGLFDEFDSKTYVLKNIIKAGTVALLSPEDREYLGMLAAVQYYRTKINRTTIVELAKGIKEFTDEYKERTKDQGLNYEKLESEIPTEEQAKLISLYNFVELTQTMTLKLLEKDLFLFQSQTPLYTSDNPVLMWNHFGYGRVGIDEYGTVISFPISSEYCVLFFCPKIKDKIKEEALKHQQDYPEEAAKALQTCHGIANQGTMVYSSPLTEFLNSIQAQGSSRFIYSKTKDFALVESILEKSPERSTVNSRVKVGGVQKYNLPNGQFALIYTNDSHYLVEIEMMDSPRAVIRFKTKSFSEIQWLFENQILITELQIITDKVAGRMSKDLIVRNSNPTDDGGIEFTIGSKDRVLDQIFDLIDKEKRKSQN